MAHQAVLNAVRDAFDVQSPGEVIDRLEGMPGGRVAGLVVVKGNTGFKEAPETERSRRMWEKLRNFAESESVNVGVVLLKTPDEAAALGLG